MRRSQSQLKMNLKLLIVYSLYIVYLYLAVSLSQIPIKNEFKIGGGSLYFFFIYINTIPAQNA